jgi:DNA-binding NtrC family response regulator
MTDVEDPAEMRVLLVGGDGALLEGLAQSFAALGYATRVAATLRDARETAATDPPLLAVVDRAIASASAGDALAIPLAAGGALVLYHTTADERTAITPALQRTVMADLALPLERHRLMALAQHVGERVRATGRANRRTPPEQSAF